MSASLLESLLEDSLKTMLTLEHGQALEGEIFVTHEESDKLAANSAVLSTDNSWKSDQSYDLNRIPVVNNFPSFLKLFFSFVIEIC